MGKEKISSIDEEKKEFTFFYEILGIISIIIALISIARFGFIGKYGMLCFRLLFGDWYFIFIIALAAMGLYFLICHKRLELKNIRYLGIVLILLALITLTHFSMHNYVKNLNGNELSNTFLLYFDYFKNGNNELMTGGGIIGCLFFYLSYFLLSGVGTVIINFIIIFIGIVFITKLTIVDFFNVIGGWFKKTFGGAFNLSKKIKSSFIKFNNDYKLKPKFNKPFKQNSLKESLNTSNDSKELSVRYTKVIKRVLDHLNIFYQDVSFLECPHLFIFFIKSHQTINFEVFRITLKKAINEKFLIRYEKENNLVIIEINRLKVLPFSLKEAIKKEEDGIVLGIDDRNHIVNTKENIVILSSNNNSYRYFLSSLILYPHFLKRCKDENYTLIDLNDHLEMLSSCVNVYSKKLEYFKDLKELFEKTIKLLNDNNASTIDEYNKKSSQKIKKEYIFISGIEKIFNYNDITKIFDYLLITSKIIGFQFVACFTENKKITPELLRNFNYKLFLKNDFDYSDKVLGYKMLDVISENEAFLKYQDLLVRINILKILPEELEPLIKK